MKKNKTIHSFHCHRFTSESFHKVLSFHESNFLFLWGRLRRLCFCFRHINWWPLSIDSSVTGEVRMPYLLEDKFGKL